MHPAPLVREIGWSEFEDDYRRLRDAAGIVPLENRTRLELIGPDAAAFLHNLCTNDVAALAPGAGCEAFLTSVQGRVLSHLLVMRTEAGVIVESSAQQAEQLAAHFDKYHILEKLEIVDRSGQTAWLLVAGPGAAAALAAVGATAPAGSFGAHATIRIADRDVSCVRYDFTSGDDFLLAMSQDDRERVVQALAAGEASECCAAAVHARRIERATPLYGIDVSDDALPQEVDRDARAISFTKGCYLGQETVARIDALGHVNRSLCLIALEIDDPKRCPAEVEFVLGEKSIGRTTSIAWSPRREQPVALAYLRRGSTEPGTSLESEGRRAVVLAKADSDG